MVEMVVKGIWWCGGGYCVVMWLVNVVVVLILWLFNKRWRRSIVLRVGCNCGCNWWLGMVVLVVGGV